jgi:hypothetical protein
MFYTLFVPPSLSLGDLNIGEEVPGQTASPAQGSVPAGTSLFQVDLMAITAEIRVTIYHEVLANTIFSNNRTIFFGPDVILPALAHVSRQIRAEFVSELLKNCVFSIHLKHVGHWLQMLHYDTDILRNVDKVYIRIPHCKTALDALPLIKLKVTAPFIDVHFVPSIELAMFRGRANHDYLRNWRRFYKDIDDSGWGRSITGFGITRVEVDRDSAKVGKVMCNLPSLGECGCQDTCACKLYKFCTIVGMEGRVKEISLCDNESKVTIKGDGGDAELTAFIAGELF